MAIIGLVKKTGERDTLTHTHQCLETRVSSYTFVCVCICGNARACSNFRAIYIKLSVGDPVDKIEIFTRPLAISSVDETDIYIHRYNFHVVEALRKVTYVYAYTLSFMLGDFNCKV